MKTPRQLRFPGALRQRQRGVTLIELSVTILIALFLLGGLFTIVQNTRNAYTSNTQLSQLQDSQRLAMTLITDVIQSTGYFPDPTKTDAAIAFPAAGVLQAGQAMSGVQSGAAPEDAITVRYMTADKDGILNCLGSSNTSGANVTYTNTFDLAAADASGNRWLECTMDDGTGAKTQPLVNGLRNMQIFYGVKRNAGSNDFNVDTYVRAGDMSAADWQAVSAVRIILTFANPVAAPTAPATITFERVIAVMNKAGVKT